MAESSSPASPGKIEFVVFELCGELFGIELSQVREVAVLPEITPVPSMPGWLLGVVNLRGEVVPVVSLAQAIGARESGQVGNRLVVVEVGARPVGIVIAGVPRIDRAEGASIEPAPELVVQRLKRDFIKGVVKQDGGLVILLDMSAIIRVEDLTSVSQE